LDEVTTVIENTRRELVLESLARGFPALTESFGLCLAQAGAVCLAEQGHQQGAALAVSGDFSATFHLYWPPVTEQMRRCWNDAEVATEYGAYRIACLLLRELTPFTVIERSRKGTGFDFWLGYEGDPLFQNMARLEVSGIRRASPRALAQRVRIKLRQTERSAGALPAYAIVVEFGAPTARVIRKVDQ
jgi:hypothetical protein